MKLLDLYSGAGIGAHGYIAAGYEVTGIDIKPQPRYPGVHIQTDALDYLRNHWRLYDLIHASPPCQEHSNLQSKADTGWLLQATIDTLAMYDTPWVVENVVSPSTRKIMHGAITLCGTMFDLGCVCYDGKYRQLQRHRYFMSNRPLDTPPSCWHIGQPVGVYGGAGGDITGRYQANKDEAVDAMETNDHYTKAEVVQGIPAAYTRWIANHIH